MNATIGFGPALVIVLVVFTWASSGVVRSGGLGQGRAVLLAAVRGVAQLACSA
ncbi:hypothetical protein ACWEOE_32145 [Amycolatopsis sp. NPDC004368]